ncbi:hypothetical protein BDZ89DRAFT_1060271 [Hymenopellis radicata]|nr:hypothetical protein BDZ89DRAFT_1060271 [Hymenopellis radicata]
MSLYNLPSSASSSSSSLLSSSSSSSSSSSFSLPSTTASSSSYSPSPVTTLRERRGVTFFIEFTRPFLEDIPAKGRVGPTAGSLPRSRRRVAPPRPIV